MKGVGGLISVIITIVVGVNLLPSIIKEAESVQDVSPTIKTIVGILPILFVAVMIACVGAFAFGPGIVRRFKWSLYGDRMKRGYEAKFGHPSKEFNKEVDQHILIMRTMKEDSTTWRLSNEWLRSRAKFVEIPWKDLGDEASEEVKQGSDYEEETVSKI
jgi:peptidoglycan/LPS O-acetylase OafA/YrhL